MFTTCFTRTYKNMYNPKSKISLLLLSSIATMLAGIQDENKRKQGDKRIEAKRKQENTPTQCLGRTNI
jgi:hypothetical protein